MADELAWSGRYESGNLLLDEQHRSLFQAINDLRHAILMGKGMAEEQRTLAFLIHYADAHFQAEEALMAEQEFPGLASHRQLHHDLLQRCRDLQEKQALGSFALQVDLYQFLATWIRQHIVGHDLAFVQYMQAKEGAAALEAHQAP